MERAINEDKGSIYLAYRAPTVEEYRVNLLDGVITVNMRNSAAWMIYYFQYV